MATEDIEWSELDEDLHFGPVHDVARQLGPLSTEELSHMSRVHAAPLPALESYHYVHVAHVERAAPYRRTAHDGPRTCFACLASYPAQGPLPHAWDVHRRGAELVLSCSTECRTAHGMPERKGGAL